MEASATSDGIYLRLGNVCTKIGSGATPRGGSKVYLDTGEVALIRSQNVYNHGFERAGLAYLTEEHAGGLSNVQVQENDVLVNITGDSVARVCQVPRDVLPARVNQHVAIVRPDPSTLSPRYLRYWLVTPAAQAQLLALASAGATRPALTKAMLEDLVVNAPRSVHEQERIAGVLGAFDEKIDLNRRMSATQEGMARALFKSWFIDFDPVRAKAEGRETGLPTLISDLFPDSFVETGLGEVPEGWSIGRIGDIAKLSRDNVRPSDFPEELFDHYSIPAFDDGRIPVAEPGDSIKSNKYAVRPTDVLLSKLNPRIPRVWLPDVTDALRAICSTEFLVAAAKEPASREYLYCLFSSAPFSAELATLVTGTSGSHQRVRPAAVLEMASLMPQRDVVKAFADQVKPLCDRVARCRVEAITLAQLRDVMLPQLLIGNCELSG